MNFEYDPEKNEINKERHGFELIASIPVFFDEYRIEAYDFEHSAVEDRYITIGRVKTANLKEELFVVYTERNDNVRLISARLATDFERRLYENGGGYYKGAEWERVFPDA